MVTHGDPRNTLYTHPSGPDLYYVKGHGAHFLSLVRRYLRRDPDGDLTSEPLGWLSTSVTDAQFRVVMWTWMRDGGGIKHADQWRHDTEQAK